jgi:hypothetical protein
VEDGKAPEAFPEGNAYVGALMEGIAPAVQELS